VKPRRTHYSNQVFRLMGGTEDNDLWLMRDEQGGTPLLRSCWVPTDEERTAIAEGSNIELIVWGGGHPPVAMGVVSYPLGAAPKGNSGAVPK
jgi:hypothetical protein